MQPIVNDFFCGCGGMGVGFLNAGYKIAGAWDFDKYAVQSYDHNVGHHVKQADIKEMTPRATGCFIVFRSAARAGCLSREIARINSKIAVAILAFEQ